MHGTNPNKNSKFHKMFIKLEKKLNSKAQGSSYSIVPLKHSIMDQYTSLAFKHV
jgi:hypothetical protein